MREKGYSNKEHALGNPWTNFGKSSSFRFIVLIVYPIKLCVFFSSHDNPHVHTKSTQGFSFIEINRLL